MESFDELGLRPELVEALLAEGIETPSELQAHAIPVLRRGNSAVLRAGPGAGTVVAYGAALLDRLESGSGQPVVLVLVPVREVAQSIARSLGRLAPPGHRVAALGGPWALPGHADLLVGTTEDVESAIRGAEVKLDGVQALVLDGASTILDGPGHRRIEVIFEALEREDLQGIVVSDPVTKVVHDWVGEYLKRCVFLPPEAAGQEDGEAPIQRGGLRLQMVESPGPDRSVVPVVAGILDETIHHVLLFFRSEDRAADAADLLTLHGFPAGSPGDPASPVWLGLDPLEDRAAVDASQVDPERVITVSLDPPPDADTLDRRHGKARLPGICVATPREVPHLRRLAREAGYSVEEVIDSPVPARDQIESFRAEVERTIEEEDLAAYMSLIEPLLERWTGVELAAGLAVMARRKWAAHDSSGRRSVESLEHATRDSATRSRPPAWTRLFLSVGSRDGVGPGDLLGAITGEAGLQGEQVGRIDIRDTFSRVEVEDRHAEKVIRALNGISIRGRSVRADFDRGSRKG